MNNLRIFFELLVLNSLLTIPSFCTQDSLLDLQGDGKLQKVKLAFKTFQSQSGDCLDLICQGGYKVYKISECKNIVAVLGPLRPCIGLVVTDGVKLIVFHKHSTNSLESLGSILKEHLDLSSKENIYARLYTTKDDEDWAKINSQEIHGNKTHTEEVLSIKNYLDQSLGIPRARIQAELQPLRDKTTKALINKPEALGRYALVDKYVAIRLNDIFDKSKSDNQLIKFSSIDPITEDVLGYNNKNLKPEDFLGVDTLNIIKEECPDILSKIVKYHDIPKFMSALTDGKFKDSLTLQRQFYSKVIDDKINQYYVNNFGKSPNDLFEVTDTFKFAQKYNTLKFYSL